LCIIIFFLLDLPFEVTQDVVVTVAEEVLRPQEIKLVSSTAKIAQPKAWRIQPTHESYEPETISGQIWSADDKSVMSAQESTVSGDLPVVATAELPKPALTMVQAGRAVEESAPSELTQLTEERASHDEVPLHMRAQKILPKPQRVQVQKAEQAMIDTVSDDVQLHAADEVAPEDVAAPQVFSAVVKLPQPTRAQVQAAELRPENVYDGVLKAYEEKPSTEDITFQSSVATLTRPKPTRAHVQAVELTPDTISEGIQPAVTDTALPQDVIDEGPTRAVAIQPVLTEVQPTAEQVKPESQSRELSPTSDAVVRPQEVSIELEISGTAVTDKHLTLVSAQVTEQLPETAEDKLVPATGQNVLPAEVTVDVGSAATKLPQVARVGVQKLTAQSEIIVEGIDIRAAEAPVTQEVHIDIGQAQTADRKVTRVLETKELEHPETFTVDVAAPSTEHITASEIEFEISEAEVTVPDERLPTEVTSETTTMEILISAEAHLPVKQESQVAEIEIELESKKVLEETLETKVESITSELMVPIGQEVQPTEIEFEISTATIESQKETEIKEQVSLDRRVSVISEVLISVEEQAKPVEILIEAQPTAVEEQAITLTVEQTEETKAETVVSELTLPSGEQVTPAEISLEISQVELQLEKETKATEQRLVDRRESVITELHMTISEEVKPTEVQFEISTAEVEAT
jgi:hypothetical protein